MDELLNEIFKQQASRVLKSKYGQSRMYNSKRVEWAGDL